MTVFIVEIFHTFTYQREYAVVKSEDAAKRYLDRVASEYAEEDGVDRTWFDDNEDYWITIVEADVLE